MYQIGYSEWSRRTYFNVVTGRDTLHTLLATFKSWVFQNNIRFTTEFQYALEQILSYHKNIRRYQHRNWFLTRLTHVNHASFIHFNSDDNSRNFQTTLYSKTFSITPNFYYQHNIRWNSPNTGFVAVKFYVNIQRNLYSWYTHLVL